MLLSGARERHAQDASIERQCRVRFAEHLPVLFHAGGEQYDGFLEATGLHEGKAPVRITSAEDSEGLGVGRKPRTHLLEHLRSLCPAALQNQRGTQRASGGSQFACFRNRACFLMGLHGGLRHAHGFVVAALVLEDLGKLLHYDGCSGVVTPQASQAASKYVADQQFRFLQPIPIHQKCSKIQFGQPVLVRGSFGHRCRCCTVRLIG